MGLFSSCSGACRDCRIGCLGGCLAGNGDDDFEEITYKDYLEMKNYIKPHLLKYLAEEKFYKEIINDFKTNNKIK